MTCVFQSFFLFREFHFFTLLEAEQKRFEKKGLDDFRPVWVVTDECLKVHFPSPSNIEHNFLKNVTTTNSRNTAQVLSTLRRYFFFNLRIINEENTTRVLRF